MAEIAILSQYLAASRDVSAKCNTATDHGTLMTLVACKRRSLLMTGDDDKVHDNKSQRYAEDNRAAFNYRQW